MSTSIRLTLNHGGVGDVLRSGAMQADLERRAAAVKSAAEGRGITVENNTVVVPITVESSGGGSRARVTVAIDHPSGLAVEAKYRLLGGSLDAAR